MMILRADYTSATGSSGDSVGNCSTDSQLTSVAGVVNYTVVVGQQINLTGCAPANGGIAVQTATWTADPQYSSTMVNGVTVGGTAVGGFSVTMDGTYDFHESITTAPAAPSCSNAQSCDFATFYYLTPGTYVFTFQYKLTNGSISPLGTIIFTVQGPSLGADGHYLNFPPTTGIVGMVTGTFPALSSASSVSINPEITVSVESSVAPPQGAPGVWQFLQTLGEVSLQIREHQGPENYTIQVPEGTNTSYPNPLDTVYPYPLRFGYANQTLDTPGTQVLGTEPWTQVVTTQGEEAETFGATMYLLWDPALPDSTLPGCFTASASYNSATRTASYDPSSCSSIPIPLEYIDWGWYGDAVNTLKSSQYTAGWYLSDGDQDEPARNLSIGAYPVWTFTCSGANKCPSLTN